MLVNSGDNHRAMHPVRQQVLGKGFQNGSGPGFMFVFFAAVRRSTLVNIALANVFDCFLYLELSVDCSVKIGKRFPKRFRPRSHVCILRCC